MALEQAMATTSTRRDLLRAGACIAGGGLFSGLLGASRARAASLQVPTVDRLTTTVVVDSSFDQFARPAQLPGVSIESGRRVSDYRRTLHNEWGLSLWLESQAAGSKRTMLLDYGYTPEVLANNL